MPPGKPLQPRLQMKVDELFRRWLSDPDTQRALSDGLRRILDDVTPDHATPDHRNPAPHHGSRPSPGPRRTTGQRAVSPWGIILWAGRVTLKRDSPITSRGSPVAWMTGLGGGAARRGHILVTGEGRWGHGGAEVTVRSKVEVYM